MFHLPSDHDVLVPSLYLEKKGPIDLRHADPRRRALKTAEGVGVPCRVISVMNGDQSTLRSEIKIWNNKRWPLPAWSDACLMYRCPDQMFVSDEPIWQGRVCRGPFVDQPASIYNISSLTERYYLRKASFFSCSYPFDGTDTGFSWSWSDRDTIESTFHV